MYPAEVAEYPEGTPEALLMVSSHSMGELEYWLEAMGTE
jgi:hypothetical protein